MKRRAAFLLAMALTATFAAAGFAQEVSAEGQEPVYGGILSYSPGVQSEQNLGYPAGDTNMLMVPNAAPALESLFKQDGAGNIMCWLVENYELSEDGKEYLFHVRQGIQFHDGTPLNAEAVVWNIQKCMDNGKVQYTRVASVEAVDEYTVKVVMNEADILFLANLATDPSGLIISPTAFEKNGAEWAEKNPVGTGPFKFVEWQNDVKVIYEKNENYWGKDENGNQLPYLDGVECLYMAETAVAEAALEAGEIQAWFRASADSIMKFADREGFVSGKAVEPSSNINMVACLDTDNPAAKKEVREAVDYAIDFDAISNGLFGNVSTPTTQCSVEGRIFYNDQLTVREYNPEKAKELLAEAGYEDGVTITIYGSQDDFTEQLCTAMGPYLQAVGITPDIQLLDTGGYFDLMMNGFNEGFLIGAYGYAPNEFGKMYNLLSKGCTIPVKNFTMDEETYQLFEDARGSASLEECAELVHQIQESIYGENVYLISMMTCYDGLIYNEGLHNSGFFEYASNHWSPETAYLTE